MNFDTNFIKIGQEIRKPWLLNNFKTVDICATILNIKWGSVNFKII